MASMKMKFKDRDGTQIHEMMQDTVHIYLYLEFRRLANDTFVGKLYGEFDGQSFLGKDEESSRQIITTLCKDLYEA